MIFFEAYILNISKKEYNICIKNVAFLFCLHRIYRSAFQILYTAWSTRSTIWTTLWKTPPPQSLRSAIRTWQERWFATRITASYSRQVSPCPLRQISPIRAYCAYLVNCFTYLSEFIAHCIDCHNETDRSFQGGRSVRLYPIYSFYAESFFLPPFRHIYTPMCASAHIPINI